MSQTQLLYIPLANVEENPVALREVDRDSPSFESLVDSIAKDGVLNPINVVEALMPDGKTPKTDAAGNKVYRICDGLHRTSAAREAGLTEIPAQVLRKSDQEVMVAQLVANAHRVETKPFEYSQQLVRILSNDQTMTISELADKLSMSPEWLNKRLGLVNLHGDIGKLVDEGKITVSNACELAKLRPQEEQVKFIDKAMTESPAVFTPAVKARIKELRDAKRAGRDPAEAGKFVPVPHLRKPGEVKAEFENPTNLTALIKAKGISDAVEAAKFTIAWMLHMDEQSIAESKAKDDARKEQAKADAKKRAADRAEQRAKEARDEANKIESSTQA